MKKQSIVKVIKDLISSIPTVKDLKADSIINAFEKQRLKLVELQKKQEVAISLHNDKVNDAIRASEEEVKVLEERIEATRRKYQTKQDESLINMKEIKEEKERSNRIEKRIESFIQ